MQKSEREKRAARRAAQKVVETAAAPVATRTRKEKAVIDPNNRRHMTLQQELMRYGLSDDPKRRAAQQLLLNTMKTKSNVVAMHRESGSLNPIDHFPGAVVTPFGTILPNRQLAKAKESKVSIYKTPINAPSGKKYKVPIRATYQIENGMKREVEAQKYQKHSFKIYVFYGEHDIHELMRREVHVKGYETLCKTYLFHNQQGRPDLMQPKYNVVEIPEYQVGAIGENGQRKLVTVKTQTYRIPVHSPHGIGLGYLEKSLHAQMWNEGDNHDLMRLAKNPDQKPKQKKPTPSSHKNLLFLARQNNVIVGFLKAVVVDWNGKHPTMKGVRRIVYIDLVCGQGPSPMGAGGRLLHDVEVWAKENGANMMMLSSVTNLETVKSYLAKGYVRRPNACKSWSESELAQYSEYPRDIPSNFIPASKLADPQHPTLWFKGLDSINDHTLVMSKCLADATHTATGKHGHVIWDNSPWTSGKIKYAQLTPMPPRLYSTWDNQKRIQE